MTQTVRILASLIICSPHYVTDRSTTRDKHVTTRMDVGWVIDHWLVVAMTMASRYVVVMVIIH